MQRRNTTAFPDTIAYPEAIMTAEVSSHIKTLKQRDMVLFMYTPGEGLQLPVVTGVIATLILGEFVIRFAENHKA
jgi:hypothetical protein